MSALPIWVTLVGFVAPLTTLAGSSVAYVIKLYLDLRDKQYNRFFQMMEYIDGDKPLATKMAAIYSLREYPTHRNFIVRFCKVVQNNINGPSSGLLIDELNATIEAFGED